MKKCTGCGRLDDKPLGLNKNGEPYLACCPDNNYKELTAVDWLIENLPNLSHKIGHGLAFEIHAKLQKAKEMEKKQIIDAWMDGMEGILHKIAAEKYYNETYGR
jgi:hypothetical protein